ncbi:uncharacterized protein LOC131946807 [Physella acuta]|uniref:uncharacterized protein LOC131946807 n=1 Tax=Physella acuta TaxID=109671 RepID=UPI0027DC1161|nr:uncharacterized protein LOC131946807 [Physella acuta]XP_059163758.1 uncharacterized protein LOC131946807 [Physella acuta]
MKRFRYDDPSTGSFFKRYRNYISAFIGWNLFGYVIWSYMTKHAAARDPDWDKKTQNEKIAYMAGVRPENTIYLKYTLFNFNKEKENEKASEK